MQNTTEISSVKQKLGNASPSNKHRKQFLFKLFTVLEVKTLDNTNPNFNCCQLQRKINTQRLSVGVMMVKVFC